MKRGYKRLLFFELILFCILILNSFVWNILSSYVMIIFLIGILIIFKVLFGLEKDKHRYLKDILMEMFIFLLVFFILYYILGIFIGFLRTSNYYTWNGLKTFIIPNILYIILRELIRYYFMCKAQDNKITIISTIVLFIFLDITNNIYFSNMTSSYRVLLFIGLSLLPAICSNIVFSYFTLKSGYKPLIFYSLVINLYQYLLPIIPNPDEYLTSIIKFLLPIILSYRLYKFYKNETNEELRIDYHKKRITPLLGTSIIVIILVYFTSGYFHYWTIAVATNSMKPKINKGDAVIVEKINNNYKNLKKGDVIAFKYHNTIIVHRIINIVKDGKKNYFYTKGDNNEKEDNFMLKENMIIGVIKFKIPYIGIPTVWLNEL